MSGADKALSDTAQTDGAEIADKAAVVPENSQADGEYRVGPGHPPREHQFKKGHTGNPLGAKLRKRSIAPDLKALLQRMLQQKVRSSQSEKLLTKAAAGMQHLVDEFAQGDRHARRDLVQICEKLGIDLTAGQHDALQQSVAAAITQNDHELIDDFVAHYVAEREAQRQSNSNGSEASESTIRK